MLWRYLLVFAFLLVFSAVAVAEDNVTVDVNLTEQVIEGTVGGGDVPEENVSQPPAEEPQEEAPDEVPEEQEEEKSPEEDEEREIIDFDVISVIPSQFKVGDAQFNIQVKNTGNTDLRDIVALVSGKGYATIDVVGIDLLEPGESSYIIVQGSFKERGGINLTIRIDGRPFHRLVYVIDPNYDADQAKAAALRKAELAKSKELQNLTEQVDELDDAYIALEAELKQKKEAEYDVADIDLSDLKVAIRSAKASLAVSDVEGAKAGMKIASEEYDYQKRKLDESEKIEQSFFEKSRNVLLVISSTVGAIVTIFAFWELMKKKKESLGEKVMKVKVEFDKRKSKKIKQTKPRKQKQKKQEASGEEDGREGPAPDRKEEQQNQ
jgi:hypothetical protein